MNAGSRSPAQSQRSDDAVIFDLDGVLTDTAELHFQSWMDISRQFDVPFDHQANDALRGLSRSDSLRLFLGQHASRFTPDQQADIMRQKNDLYVARLTHMKPDDALPGARELIDALRQRGVKLAVASSSKNAPLVLDKLGLRDKLDALADGNDVALSKPDPALFLEAARRLGVKPARCVVVEDAESGVAGALAAGMKVIGVGPRERIGRAHRVVPAIADLTADSVLALLNGTN